MMKAKKQMKRGRLRKRTRSTEKQMLPIAKNEENTRENHKTKWETTP